MCKYVNRFASPGHSHVNALGVLGFHITYLSTKN